MITNSFRVAVENGDIVSVRAMIKNSMLVDSTFDELNQMMGIAKDLPGLYEPYDEGELSFNQNDWAGNDYIAMMMSQLVGNFCHERIEHLKKVVGHLRPAALRSQQTTSASRTEIRQTPPSPAPQPLRSGYQKQSNRDRRNDRIVSNRGTKIAVGAVAGGVAGGVVAGITSVSVLIGTITGAAVVGAIVAVTTNGE